MSNPIKAGTPVVAKFLKPQKLSFSDKDGKLYTTALFAPDNQVIEPYDCENCGPTRIWFNGEHYYCYSCVKRIGCVYCRRSAIVEGKCTECGTIPPDIPLLVIGSDYE